jgi:ubiquinone/menaquinone biosynthesis C-methylase UbiE
MSIQTTSHTWKNMPKLWLKTTSPLRPTNKSMKQYEDSLLKLSMPEPNILILGSTPEIRQLAYMTKPNAKLICCDLNQEMFEQMSIEISHNPNEKFVLSNWTDIGLPDSYFDLILGDAVYGNIDIERQDLFLSKVKSLLKPTGEFVTRFIHLPQRYEEISFDSLLYHVEKEGCQLNISEFTILYLSLFARKHNQFVCNCKKGFEYIQHYWNMVDQRYEHRDYFVNQFLDHEIFKGFVTLPKEWVFEPFDIIQNQINLHFVTTKTSVDNEPILFLSQQFGHYSTTLTLQKN